MRPVLRVTGNEFDPQSFVKRFGFGPDLVRRAGIPDSVGRVRSKSGFNLTIAARDSGEAFVRNICEWVDANRLALQAVEASGGSAEIDVGLSVGASGQFTVSVTWTPSQLALLAECGVDLCVSAYPSSNADDARPGPAV